MLSGEAIHWLRESFLLLEQAKGETKDRGGMRHRWFVAGLLWCAVVLAPLGVTSSKMRPCEVAVTGSSGFFGRHLLSSFPTSSHKLAHPCCLCVVGVCCVVCVVGVLLVCCRCAVCVVDACLAALIPCSRSDPSGLIARLQATDHSGKDSIERFA